MLDVPGVDQHQASPASSSTCQTGWLAPCASSVPPAPRSAIPVRPRRFHRHDRDPAADQPVPQCFERVEERLEGRTPSGRGLCASGIGVAGDRNHGSACKGRRSDSVSPRPTSRRFRKVVLWCSRGVDAHATPRESERWLGVVQTVHRLAATNQSRSPHHTM
jgi:hypothetical protein